MYTQFSNMQYQSPSSPLETRTLEELWNLEYNKNKHLSKGFYSQIKVSWTFIHNLKLRIRNEYRSLHSQNKISWTFIHNLEMKDQSTTLQTTVKMMYGTNRHLTHWKLAILSIYCIKSDNVAIVSRLTATVTAMYINLEEKSIRFFQLPPFSSDSELC